MFPICVPRRDVGVGWLWLAAHGGAFGEIERVFSDVAPVLGHRCGSDLGVVLHELDEAFDVTSEGG